MKFTRDQLIEAYRRMLRIRRFEEEGARAVRAGKIPGMHSSIGQEGAIVGACFALRNDDYITGTHRSHGHPIGKGAELRYLMAELWGKATGICGGRGGSMHLADHGIGSIGESAIVGGGIPLATGAGLSIVTRGTDQVSLCFFGDGAANQGTLGESLNLAAIWKLPVIFFCENNRYAISTSTAQSHGHADVARRADGYGLPGIIVDGQDAEAVYSATMGAVARARSGEGPSLIEAKTYRFDEHCADLFVPIAYRTDEEVEWHKAERDPLILHDALMESRGLGDARRAQVRAEVETEITHAMVFAEESPFPDFAGVYDNMFSNPIHYPPAASAAHE